MAHVRGHAGSEPHLAVNHQGKVDIAVLARVPPRAAAVEPCLDQWIAFADACHERIDAAPDQGVEVVNIPPAITIVETDPEKARS